MTDDKIVEINCPVCNGSGSVPKYPWDLTARERRLEDQGLPVYRKCDHCKGSGKVKVKL